MRERTSSSSSCEVTTVVTSERALPETLKKMMSVVTEKEKETPLLWGMGVVAMAVVMRFLHALAQKELSAAVMEAHSDTSPSLITLTLACLQVAAALAMFRVSGLNFSTSNTSREAAITGIIGYVGGLFLTNYLLWSLNSASSACFAAQEPLLCMALLYTVGKVPTERHRAGAVVCVCVGAALLTTDFTVWMDSRALLRVLASLFLLVRNVVVKHLYDHSVSFAARSQSTIVTVVVAVSVAAVMVSVVMASGLVMALLLAVLTGALSVTLLHLMFKLLLLYDTLTVAVFMLWAQVLENVVLMTELPQPGALCIVLGAAMFALGHYVYFKDGLESGTIHLNIKRVGVNELLTRLQFLLYAGSIIGVTVTLLRPTISERDIKALSFVGLDRIARRLLNTHPAEH